VKILVADDSQFLRERLSKHLARLGYEVLQTGDGEGAICLCRFERPDVVFLDIVMPGLNGLEALKEIREVSPDTLVVVVSSVGHEGIISEAMRLGAVDFVTKPVTPEQLVARLERLLKSARA
jgi:DNA-binding response OmpR family regulator